MEPRPPLLNPPFPHIRVEGGPRERGRSYGEQAARAHPALDRGLWRGVFDHYAGWDWGQVRREAARYRDADLAASGASTSKRSRGIAEGAGVDVEADVLAINVRTEVMFAAKARAAEAELGDQAATSRTSAAPSPCSPRGAPMGTR